MDRPVGRRLGRPAGRKLIMSCHENEALAEKLMDHYLALGYSEEEAEALTEKEMDRRVLI